jgi:hypothetical protein
MPYVLPTKHSILTPLLFYPQNMTFILRKCVRCNLYPMVVCQRGGGCTSGRKGQLAGDRQLSISGCRPLADKWVRGSGT